MVLDLSSKRVLTFDCYGTLIDWEQGIVDALQPVLRRHGVTLDDDGALEVFGTVESPIQQAEYRSYYQVLVETLVGIADKLGFVLEDDETTALADSVKVWPPFPDSREALKRLKQHYKLVIYSNIDDDLFAHSARLLDMEFDDVITAQQVGSYKPALAHFEVGAARIGVPQEQHLHVAQSLYHDIEPANQLDIDSVWVNRRHARPGSGATPEAAGVPDLEVPDLKTLADLADAAFGGRNERGWDLDTRLVHLGAVDAETGGVTPPIHMAVTYVREAIDDDARWRYARGDNPTRANLEAVLAEIEHGAGAVAFSSGMAAVTAAHQLLNGGDHAIVGYDCYLSTYNFFANDLPRYGIQSDFVDLGDIEAVQAAVRPNTKMIWIESPTNPLLDLVDFAAMAEIAESTGALTVVDNTFGSPYCQNPLDWGIDIVVHSTTKYLGGHSDLTGGVAVARKAEVVAQLKDRQYYLGAVPSAFDCWLLLRGIRTLGVRMSRHNANAQAVAEALEAHPKVLRVLYPGLPNHPQHELAQRQMTGGYSGMVSFEVAGGTAGARRISELTKVFQLATSLGSVDSLIYPPTAWMETAPELMAAIPGSPWAQNPGLVRLSVGIESAKDLVADLEQALDKL